MDDKILNAAFKEFHDKGFQDASLRSIAYEAGITIGAIHTRYRTKDDLFRACITPLMDDLRPGLEKVHGFYDDLVASGEVNAQTLTETL